VPLFVKTLIDADLSGICVYLRFLQLLKLLDIYIVPLTSLNH